MVRVEVAMVRVEMAMAERAEVARARVEMVKATPEAEEALGGAGGWQHSGTSRAGAGRSRGSRCTVCKFHTRLSHLRGRRIRRRSRRCTCSGKGPSRAGRGAAARAAEGRCSPGGCRSPSSPHTDCISCSLSQVHHHHIRRRRRSGTCPGNLATRPMESARPIRNRYSRFQVGKTDSGASSSDHLPRCQNLDRHLGTHCHGLAGRRRR